MTKKERVLIAELYDALKRMDAMHDMVMAKDISPISVYDTDTFTEMTEALAQAKRAIRKYEQTRK